MKFTPARAHVPIVLAGDGPLILQLAGEVADAAMIAHCASPRILAGRLAHVAAGDGAAAEPTSRGDRRRI